MRTPFYCVCLFLSRSSPLRTWCSIYYCSATNQVLCNHSLLTQWADKIIRLTPPLFSDLVKLTSSWTKWPSFRRRYFRMHFLEWKCMNFDKNALKFAPKDRINNYLTLVRIMVWRRQTIIWTNDGYVTYRRKYASLGLNGLTEILAHIYE